MILFNTAFILRKMVSFFIKNIYAKDKYQSQNNSLLLAWGTSQQNTEALGFHTIGKTGHWRAF